MWATVNGSHIWDRNNPCHDEDKRLHALAEVSHICRGNNKREQRTVSMFELSWDRRWCLSRVDMGVGASLVLVLLEQPRNRRLCPLCRTPIQQVAMENCLCDSMVAQDDREMEQLLGPSQGTIHRTVDHRMTLATVMV